MSKIIKYLNVQINSDLRQDAEECLLVYKKLKEINNGRVWSSEWNLLVDVKFKGLPYDDRTYSLSKIGKIFLKGVLCEKN